MDFRLANLGNLVAASGGGEHHGTSYAGMLVYVGLVLAIVFTLLQLAKGGFKERIFHNWFTQRFEQLYLFIENLAVGTIGAHGKKYIPMLMTFWLVIFVGNVVALFMPTSPTADLSFNLAMALIAVGYVQWEGIRANGLFGHLRHFAGPKLGPAFILLSIMIFIIEIISELMKNLSLSLRLYGNIDGGHQAAEAINALGKNIIPITEGFAISIPFGALLLPIKFLTCIVQALIFCLLLSVYISLVTHHDEDHAHDDHGHADGTPVPAH